MPDTGSQVLAWDGQALMPEDRAPDRNIKVADSWLLDNGSVRALAAHHERFAGSCRREAGLSASAVRRFLAAVTAGLPAQGRWFPRVECARSAGGRDELLVLLRPAPAPSEGVVLTHQRGDPRRKPRVKGPDLATLLALRESAARAGACEVVLLTDAGVVIEGALSAIVWWRGDTLCVPDSSLATLDSVTRGLVTAMAAERGIRVSPERTDLASLAGLEIWSLSALHGIRPVTGWHHAGFSPLPGPPRRAAAWQADLLSLARPVIRASKARVQATDQHGQEKARTP